MVGLSMKRHLLPIAAAMVAAGCPLAQGQAPATAGRVEVRLLAFEAPPGEGGLFIHDAAAKETAPGVAATLKGYLNHESSVLTLLGRELVFTTLAEHASIHQPASQLGRVTLPAGARECILLFLPQEQDGRSTWKVLPIDDSTRVFPPGSLLIVNLSRNPVRIRLEQTDYAFKSGESKVITDPPVGANHHSTMTAHAFLAGEWQRIGAGLWPHPGRKRSVQVLFDDPASDQCQLRGFRDVVEKANPQSR